jgi:hypothetical protein
MYVICEVCDGTGMVSDKFGMGKHKKIEGDIFHQVCPACDGTGIQLKLTEERKYLKYSNPWKPCPKKIIPWEPPGPFKPYRDPPYPWNDNPFDPCNRKRKRYYPHSPIWC